jgi:hypothetical protein
MKLPVVVFLSARVIAPSVSSRLAMVEMNLRSAGIPESVIEIIGAEV